MRPYEICRNGVLRARVTTAGRSARGTSDSADARTPSLRSSKICRSRRGARQSSTPSRSRFIRSLAASHPAADSGSGIGYDSPEDRAWYRDAKAHDHPAALLVGRGRRSAAARCRSARRLAYSARFVTWAGSNISASGRTRPVDDRTAFRLRETMVGTRGWFRPVPAVRVGGSVRPMCPISGAARPAHDVRSKPSSRKRRCRDSPPSHVRPISRLRRVHAPGIRNDEDLLDDPTRYRGAYQLAFEAVRDYDSGRHDFHRWETEVQQRIPGFMTGPAPYAARLPGID